EHIVKVGVFSTAARELGLSDITYSRSSIQLFDGSVFNADDPLGYLNNLEIKRDFTMTEIIFDRRSSAA
ncbi:MAG: nitrate ABC transporter ATP-binding protein, partial [Microcoleaceae cyanobacterium]